MAEYFAGGHLRFVNGEWRDDNGNTIEISRVRHGQWVQVIVHVEFEDGFVDRVEECCSACHAPNERRCTYFCPNCGAKMDGGDGNSDMA